MRKSLVGEKFGRLTVIEFVELKYNNTVWKCLCDCGNFTIVNKAHLGRDANSCGCFRKEITSRRLRKHGMTTQAEHRTWLYMRNRCYNKNLKCYENYGGRGIKVCDRWLFSFENFYEDMGKRPDGYSIERIDNDGDYSPENCKWIPMSEQAKNKRNVVKIRYNGEIRTMKEWSIITNLSVATIEYRYRAGWDVEKMMTKPMKGTIPKLPKQPKIKTNCKSGKHLWNDENVHIRNNGVSLCKICRNEGRTKKRQAALNDTSSQLQDV